MQILVSGMLYPAHETWLPESFTDVRVSGIGRGLACRRSQGLETPRKLSFLWHAYRAHLDRVISKDLHAVRRPLC